MRKYAQSSIQDLDPTSWFDYWHCHVDWEGKGNKRPENREATIALGLEIFEMVEEFKQRVEGPIQSWWFIHEQSYEDAIYLHSPNENDTPYPYDFKGVQWGATASDYLNGLLSNSKYKVGTLKNEYGTTYVVASNA